MDMHILFNVRNLWTEDRNFWKGRWSKNSLEWTEESKKTLGYNFKTSMPHFWMSLEDIKLHFN